MAKQKPKKHTCSKCDSELDKDGVCLECDFCEECNSLLEDGVCLKCNIIVKCGYCEVNNVVPKDGPTEQVQCKKCSSYLKVIAMSDTMKIKCKYCETINTINTVDLNDSIPCTKCSSYLPMEKEAPHLQRDGYYGFGVKQGNFFGDEYGPKDFGYVR